MPRVRRKKKYPNWGGYRKGAGRKPVFKRATMVKSVIIELRQMKKLEEIAKACDLKTTSEAIRLTIDEFEI
jgi:hypothetical protein